MKEDTKKHIENRIKSLKKYIERQDRDINFIFSQGKEKENEHNFWKLGYFMALKDVKSYLWGDNDLIGYYLEYSQSDNLKHRDFDTSLPTIEKEE